ncbi:MAG: hypothetical protein JNK67_04075 [Alphaproteobacteria bacterium]|nr:hypothetical protein [Alphaproteobacteria bacterium]
MRVGPVVAAFLVGIAACTPDERGRPRTADGGGSGAVTREEVPLEPAAFTAHMAGRFAALRPDVVFTVRAPLEIEAARGPGTETMSINLHRPWSFCSRGAGDCAGSLDRFTDGLQAALQQDAVPPLAANLRSVVRTQAVVAEARSRIVNGRGDVLAEPLAGPLWVVLVEDSPRTVRYVTTQDAEALRLSREAMFARARANTRALLGPLDGDFSQIDRKGIGMVRGGFFVSSRVLFVEDWRPLAEFFDGSLVVAMPEPGSVLFARGDNPQLVAELERAAVEVMRSAERPLAPTILRWSPAGWQSIDSRPRGPSSVPPG